MFVFHALIFRVLIDANCDCCVKRCTDLLGKVSLVFWENVCVRDAKAALMDFVLFTVTGHDIVYV